jgi:diguanylate cyclase (GGDEF)-like protein/PAS domain S-box-containing protein
MQIRRVAAVYAGLVIAATALHLWYEPASSAGVVVVGLASAGAVAYGIRRYRPPHATSWWLLAAAVVANATARVVYDLLPGDIGTLKPWMWVVWALHLIMLVLLMTGALGLARSTLRGASTAIDAAIIVLGASLIGGILIAIPYASTPGVSDLWRTVRVGYVFRDVLVLALAIHLATAIRWNRSVKWFLASLLGLVAYDVLFRLGRIHGEWLAGTSVDLVWLLFSVGIGAAALTRTMVMFDTPLSVNVRDGAPLRIGLVAVLALMPSAVLLLGLFQKPPWYQPLIVICATVILILALARIVDVALQLRRQVDGERVLRQAVTELAAAQEVSAVEPMIDTAVGRLLGPDVDYHVAIVCCASESADRPWPDAVSGGLFETSSLPPPVADELGNRGLTLAIQLIDRASAEPRPEDIVGYIGSVGLPSARGVAADEPGATDPSGFTTGSRLLVRSDRSSLLALRPRLEALATQAAFTFERIRLNKENVRHTSESYFRTLVQNSTDVILIVDDDNRIRYASPSAGSVFGPHALTGVALPELVAQSDRQAAERLLTRARADVPGTLADDTSTAREPDHGSRHLVGDRLAVTDVVRDGDWIVDGDGAGPARVEVSCRDLRADPSIDGLVLTLRNVTTQRLLESELERRAFHDPLTGLGNRLPFIDRLNSEVDRAHDTTELAAVLYVDLDDLKLVNDALGHETGDALLSAVGDRLRSFVAGYGGPNNSMAARLGGDEFAVLLADVADDDTADAAAGRLLATLAQPVHVGGHEVTCGASVGVATTAQDADTAPNLLRNADLALYAAKNVGKGQWRHYEAWMSSTVMARLELRTSLERAIDDDALVVEYQPIVGLADGQPTGFEALLRWEHPSRGRLSPDQFIDVAEESGLIAPIGEWVLRTAMEAALSWGTSEDSPYVGINVSARQFRTPGFTATVHRLLAQSGLRPDRVTLEITESLLLRDDDSVWQDLQSLRRFGVRIAIDDFGTGYSALSYLRHVPLDVVKLDRSFIQSMAASVKQRELVQGIVGLADVLGLQVIAEGIETEQERDLAARIGCAYGQGFLFSPALPVDETRRWLRRRVVRPPTQLTATPG